MSNVATRVIVGRRTKWLVLVFWIVLVGLAGPFAGKLTGAQKNDAKNWLPSKAESTKVLGEASAKGGQAYARLLHLAETRD